MQNNIRSTLISNYQGKLPTLFKIAPKWEQRLANASGARLDIC